MATEPTVEEVQEKLLKLRREQGISETVKPIRSIVKKQSEEIERQCTIHNTIMHGFEPCPQCIAAWEENEKAEQEKIRIQNEEKAKYIFNNPEQTLFYIGVGKRHLKCSFENYQGGEKIKEICKEIVTKPLDLLLTGNAGSGKTHLAVAIFREWVKTQKVTTNNALFITVTDLLLEIREVFSDKTDKTEAEIVNKYAREQYLILDDLGAEKTSEWSITTLYTIIDQRYRQELPTIVTTNLTIDQIGSQISERIASRLSSGKVIKINAPDYRKKRG